MSNHRLNAEQYRTRSASATQTTTTLLPGRNVTRKRDKIKLTQRYKILSATDPNTRRHYTLAQLLDSNILNKYTSTFCLPSTGEVLPLDEAIQKGWVHAELISECLESSNDLFRSIQSVDRYVRINDLRACSSSCVGGGTTLVKVYFLGFLLLFVWMLNTSLIICDGVLI
jgi:hypothetical protein